MNQTLTKLDEGFISFQESMAERIITLLQSHSQSKGLNYAAMAQRIKDLREEATRAKEADLPALFDQLNSEKALFERTVETSLPPLSTPYFAHLRLQDEQGERDILIGQKTFLDSEPPIIDWRHAPIARIFFKYRTGDQYEEKLPGRLAIGKVIERNILTFQQGQLVAIHAEGKAWIKSEGRWLPHKEGSMPILRGGEGASSYKAGQMMTDISALLDPEQYTALTKDPEAPLLIRGTAGSGKTTVALHRTAHLLYNHPEQVKAQSTRVIVPDRGLAELSRRLLAGLGIKSVRCTTYDSWAQQEARLLLKKLPTKLCDQTPANVQRVKRHPQMIAALKELEKARREDLRQEIIDLFKKPEPMLTYMAENPNLALFPLMSALEQIQLKATKDKKRQKVIKTFYKNQRQRLQDPQRDREDLFLSRRFIKAAIEAADDLNERDQQHVWQHSVAQMGVAPDEEFADIDEERLAAVDGRNLLEEAKNDPVYKSIDAEDFTLLLQWEALKKGSEFKWRSPLSHLVVDEAQDLAPLELQTLALGVSPHAAMTVAGDEAQAIDEAAHFIDWQTTLLHLGCHNVRRETFVTAYRSTKQITEFAHKILGPYAPNSEPIAKKSGQDVALTNFPNEGHAMIKLEEILTDLMLSEPRAYIAVVAKSERSADEIYQTLRDVPRVERIYDGQFRFTSGVEITDVTQVKGLEFDYVIIPDASGHHYPATLDARRKLHVAATRAIHQLWVISVGKPSPILQEVGAEA